jgi:hypothetical protein
MADIELKGMTFWAVTRCSTTEQIEESLPAQREAITRWAKDKGIIIGKWIDLAGKSATYSEQMDDLLRIIEQKHSGAAFDGLLLDSYARFVRSEVDSNILYAKAIDAELLVATVKDGLLMGEGKWAIRGSAADQATGYVRDLGRNTARTVGQLTEQGIIPPTVQFVYGTIREYYGPDGNPTFQVVKHPDGRIEVRDHLPPHATLHFMPEGIPRLALRAKGGKFQLIPSGDIRSETVRWMFRQHFINKWTAYKIAVDLNTRGVPPPRAGGWRTLGVIGILNNPLYLGYSVGMIRGTGIHVFRGKGYPQVLPLARRPGRRLDGRGQRVKPVIRYRDPSEWVISEQPAFLNFLDLDVREPALAEWHRKQKEGWKRPRVLPQTSNLSGQSSYFLSRILTTPDNGPMVGVKGCGRGSFERYRYYQTSRSLQTPSHGRRGRNLRADIVEDEVRRAMAEVVSVPENIEAMIKNYIVERQREVVSASLEVQELKAEQERLENWFKNVFSSSGLRGQQILVSEAKRVEVRLEQIDGLLSRIANADILSRDVDAIVAAVKTQLQSLTGSLDSNDRVPIRRLAEVLVSKLVYDSEKQTIDFELGLPEWAVFQHDRLRECTEFRPEAVSGCKSCVRAKNDGGVILLMSRCLRTKRKNESPCLSCQRLTDPALTAA